MAAFGSPHCLAVNSGTSALLTALVAHGVGPGDEVIVPGYTFIASIAAIVYAGATPVLAEIDESLTLDVSDVERRISSRTKAIMPVHMLGGGADSVRLARLAAERSLVLIEDVAQACGASQDGRALGTIGSSGAFSLNYFKVITSGEGGFCLFSDPKVYERAYAFHDHGFSALRDGAVDGDATFGQNLRMPDLSGAVALAQLRKLPRILARTRTVKAALVAAIGELPGVRQRPLADVAGECATTLCFVFDEASHAEQVAKVLNTMTLAQSGKHYYANMPQLRHVGTSALGAAAGRSETQLPSTRRGDLPQTDDVLARTVAVSTGTSDWYAGTGFGVTVHSSDDDIEACAAAFADAVRGA
jgi:dTDP-4-amino-4,6-dideoxygalactose transaminase